MNLLLRSTPLLAAVAFAGASGVQGSSAQRRPAQDKPTVCKLEGVFDGATHQNAFTYFLPKGWDSHGSFAWVAAQPGSFHVTIAANTPDHQYEVTQTGQEGYVYKVTYPFDGGPPFIFHTKVHHATEYLRVVLDGVAKADGASDVEVVDEVNAPLPDDRVTAFQKSISNMGISKDTPLNETGFLQVKFTRGGQPMIALLGTTLRGTLGIPARVIGKPAGQSEGGTFAVGPTTVLIMPADAPKQRQRETQIVAASIRMTPQFGAYLRELIDRLIRIRLGAAAAGQRYAAATFHERAMSQFSQQMHMKDAYSHAFCNYVSDAQDYKDQSGHVVTAPASYRCAWSDGRGNYLFNDDPTVNLNGVGSGSWKLMQKAKIGE